MESANLHQQQQQLQDLQLIGSSSSSSLDTEASCYGVSTTHSWSPNVSLNSSNFNHSYTNRNNSDCLSLTHMHNNDLIQQGLSVQWHNQSSYDHHQNLASVKEELSSSSDQSLTDMLKINDEHHKDLNDLSEKLLLKTISSGFPMNSGEYCNYSSSPHRGNFSQIYPSINISNPNQSPRMNINVPRSFDMNLQTLDGNLYSGSSLINPVSQDINLGTYKGSLPFGLGDRRLQQQSIHQLSCSPSDQYLKMSHFTSNDQTSETKRPSSLVDSKGGGTASKKPRVESRASCPPLKIRKEKLGDRIAALQQLVAPFGKTDTASVLMEAIGYIKFLQTQVETLSVPYMRASRNRTGKTSKGGSTVEEGNEEQRRDLRSRGLCLVPLSCMSYVTGDGVVGGGGGGFWPPPPGFGGGT